MSVVESAVPAGAKLDLGCGGAKCSVEHIGVDVRPLAGVDIVDEALVVLQSLPDGHLAEVHSSHFLEHVEDPATVLSEICRVLRPGGRCEIVVPHFSNPYYYSDLTHRHPWGLYTLGYLIEEVPFKRSVPQYREALPFSMTFVRLVFKSPRPFCVRYGFKRAVGTLANLSRGTQEFYEENLTWLVPCYELRFTLTRR